MKRWILVAMLAGMAAPAQAQVPGVTLQLVPKVGGYFPMSSLTEAGSAFGEAAAELETSLAIGLAAELDLPASPLNLRANFDYATSSRLSREGVAEGEGAETTVLALTGDLVFRPLPRIVVLQPYLLAGGGIKKYDFETRDLQGGTGEFFSSAESDPTLHVGAGLDLKLGPLALLAEVSDYVSWFKPESAEGSELDSRIQHDVFAMLGVRVGLF